MTFILSKLAWEVMRPSVLLLLLCWFGLGLMWARRPLWGYRLLTAGIGGYTLVLLLPVGTLASLPLEDRFPRPAEPSRVDGIIVLSGAIEPDLSRDRGIVSLNSAAERMTETVALARRHPQARVVFTGASGDILPDGATEAEWARPLFLSLGVDPARITYEYASRNTYENALNSWRLIHPTVGEHWLLVTSANHMPRAVGVFRHIGWNVTAWPVAYQSGYSLRTWMRPSMSQRLGSFDAAAHEWLGLLAYRLMNRTDTLFPAPVHQLH
jgi:uncharacterized SAM-binding protein YcdF (DUF218 family)